MSWEGSVLYIPGAKAYGDLSSYKYHAVVCGSDGLFNLCGTEGMKADGVLQDAPTAANQACAIAYSGIVKMYTGAATVTRGDLVMTDSTGHAKTCTTAKYAIGRALETSATAGDLISVLLGNGTYIP